MDPATFDQHVAWFRDYEAEAALIHDIIRRNASETRTIIELGCGTGNLMLALCRIGYDLVGVDNSKDMLGRAAQKLERAGYSARLVHGDVADGISSPGEYDVTVGTFSLVFNFFPEARLGCFFQTAAALTRSNGLLVLNGFSLETTQRTHPDGTVVMRGINPLNGNIRPTYDRVDYWGSCVQITVFHAADWMTEPLTTKYSLRTYTVPELEAAANRYCFELLDVRGYPQPGAYEPGASDEYFAVFAKKSAPGP